MVWYSPYIISDKGNDLIPGAKAYSDPSATIRKASTFILDMRKVFDNRSLDYNEGWKRLLPEEILEVLSKRTNDLLVVSSFQTGTRPKETLPPKLRGRKFPNDRKPLADIVAEGYFRE
jgi:hypothetical protein